jgi:2-keto-4-pentenoate hydratase/2-oxohepta-3-ene-1,7-dioic acid hydratase in catechol pathway
MKLLQFTRNNQICLGIWTASGIVDVGRAALLLGEELPFTMEELIACGERGLKVLQGLIDRAREDKNGAGLDTAILSPQNIKYAPCLSTPEKIICIGLNYGKHARETKGEIPATPIIFSKFANALAAHQEIIKLPAGAHEFDYEAELVIVIGRTARSVAEEEALSYVFGYTAGNDVSARDLQFRPGQWLLGKTCDGFAPIGPWIVTADELGNPDNLDVSCRVNGELRQSASTKDMIFSCASIISYISRYMTLKPGDLIFTGTPDGVILGYPKPERIWLKAGDKVEVTIESIGTLTNVLASMA